MTTSPHSYLYMIGSWIVLAKLIFEVFSINLYYVSEIHNPGATWLKQRIVFLTLVVTSYQHQAEMATQNKPCRLPLERSTKKEKLVFLQQHTFIQRFIPFKLHNWTQYCLKIGCLCLLRRTFTRDDYHWAETMPYAIFTHASKKYTAPITTVNSNLVNRNWTVGGTKV